MTELETLTNTIATEIGALNKEFEAKKAEFTKGLQERLHDLVSQAFVEDPNLLAICWTQYTPYFNDGEPCEFSVGDINALVLDDEIQDQLDDDMTIEDILQENWYEGNVPYDLQADIKYLEYLKTGKFDRTGTYLDYPHWRDRCKTVAAEVEQYCSTQLSEYPANDSNSIAKLEAKVSKYVVANKVTGALSQIPDEIMEDLFGDHVRVLITKDGIDVAEYDHD